MTEFYQFMVDNSLLAGAWILVAIALLTVQIRLTTKGPVAISSQTLTHLVNRQEAVVVDIRGQAEFAKGHIQGAINIPMSQLKDSMADLEKYQGKPIIMVCANGIQVSAGCAMLTKAGIEKVHKLTGGMTSWVGDYLPVVKS